MLSDSEQTSETSLAWWVTQRHQGALLQTALDSIFDSQGEFATVEALYSGISRGTESLVFSGRVPESEFHRMRAPFQEGEFSFPVKYGYASVGRVVSGPHHLRERLVFCLFPHQKRYRVPVAALHLLPRNVPPTRAVLAANMETAVNGVWDGAPGIGDRIAVVGLGVVGLLVAWLANSIPGARVTAIDVNEDRKAIAEELGLTFSTSLPQEDHDLVFHTSGHPSGLETAMAAAGNESTVVEMSWYGSQPVVTPLGGAFHARRLSLRSSQVGQVAQGQRSRWDFRRRMELALELLAEDRLDGLITGESAFTDLPEVMPRILTDGRNTLCHRIVY